MSACALLGGTAAALAQAAPGKPEQPAQSPPATPEAPPAQIRPPSATPRTPPLTVGRPPVQREKPGYDVQVNAEAAVEASKPIAAKANRRIVVFFGNSKSRFDPSLANVTRGLDIAKLFRMEHVAVFADVLNGPHAQANLEFAKRLGAKPTPEDDHGWVVILDAAGAKLAAVSLARMGDDRRRSQYSPLKLQDWLAEHQAPRPSAQELVSQAAKAARTTGQSALLVVFSEFEEPWGERLQSLLEHAEVQRMLSKHVRVVPIVLERHENAGDYMDELSERKATGMPWYCGVNLDGKVLSTSQIDEQANIGYPSTESEIDALVAMIGKAAVSMNADEKAAIRAAVVSAQKAAEPGGTGATGATGATPKP